MHHNRAPHQCDQQVIDHPGVGSGLNHNSISRKQIGLGPLSPALELDPARREHDAFVDINATDHEVVFVDVDRDVATPNWNGRVSHARLLVPKRLNGGGRIYGLSGSHTDASVTSCCW